MKNIKLYERINSFEDTAVVKKKFNFLAWCITLYTFCNILKQIMQNSVLIFTHKLFAVKII